MIILYSLFISSVVVAFFYVISFESTRNTYDMQYKSILDSFRDSMDSTLQNITNSITHMSEDSNFLNACISPSPVNYTNIRFILLTSANLAEPVKEFAFYKIGSDRVVSSGHKDMSLASYELGDFLQEYLEGRLTGSYMAYNNRYTGVYQREDEFIFVRDFPIRGEKRLGIILCRVDRYSLYRWFKRTQSAYTDQLYVFDRDGVPLFGDYMEYSEVVLSSYQSCRNDGITQLTRNGLRMYYTVSSSSGWSFLLAATQNAPLSNWSENARYLPVILAIISLLSLGISISLRNTIVAPLQRMVDTFCDPDTMFQTASKNELEQLSTTFSGILNNRNRLNATLNELLPTISDQFFTDLLCKKAMGHDYIQRTLNTIGSGFTPEGDYALVVLNEQSANMLYSIELLRGTAEKILGRYTRGLAEKRIQWLDVPRHMAILLQCSPEVNNAERIFLLENICQELYSKMSQQFPQILWRHTIFCGRLADLCFTYSHIITVPEASDPFPPDDSASQIDYSHFQDRIDAAMAAFCEGDTAETLQILSSCVNSVASLFSSAQTQYDFMQMFEHVFKDELCKSTSKAITELATVIVYTYDGKLSTCDNTVAYRQALLSYCASVCSQLQEYNVKRKHKSLVAAQNYIMLHYRDISLSLESVAEAVKINPAYLSKLFVNNIGISFVHYMNDLRIEKACQLLQNSDMPVKDIGAAVGFSSQQNFFRVFKKFKGITPGQYKAEGTETN